MPPVVILHTLREPSEMQACEPLFHEYMAWLVDRLHAEHNILLEVDEVESVHAAFRAEWPKLLGPRGRVVVARSSGATIGVGTLKPVSEVEVELKRLFVQPTLRGVGVGRRILEHLIAEARRVGYREMRLETFGFMRSALDLYRSVGFAETPRFEGVEGSSHGTAGVELFMRLRLGVD